MTSQPMTDSQNRQTNVCGCVVDSHIPTCPHLWTLHMVFLPFWLFLPLLSHWVPALHSASCLHSLHCTCTICDPFPSPTMSNLLMEEVALTTLGPATLTLLTSPFLCFPSLSAPHFHPTFFPHTSHLGSLTLFLFSLLTAAPLTTHTTLLHYSFLTLCHCLTLTATAHTLHLFFLHSLPTHSPPT